MMMDYSCTSIGADHVGASGREHRYGKLCRLQVAINRNLPPSCNVLHRNAWVSYANEIISSTALKLLSPEATFSAQNASDVVWRPDSVWIRRGGELERSSRPFSRGGEKNGNKGKDQLLGKWRKEERGIRELEDGKKRLHTHRSVQKSAAM